MGWKWVDEDNDGEEIIVRPKRKKQVVELEVDCNNNCIGCKYADCCQGYTVGDAIVEGGLKVADGIVDIIDGLVTAAITEPLSRPYNRRRRSTLDGTFNPIPRPWL